MRPGLVSRVFAGRLDLLLSYTAFFLGAASNPVSLAQPTGRLEVKSQCLTFRHVCRGSRNYFASFFPAKLRTTESTGRKNRWCWGTTDKAEEDDTDSRINKTNDFRSLLRLSFSLAPPSQHNGSIQPRQAPTPPPTHGAG